MTKNRRVKVAFATRGGEQVDAGFEQTEEIVVCEISTTEAKELCVLHFSGKPKDASVKQGGCGSGEGKKSGGCGGGKKKEESIDEQDIDARVAALAGVSVLLVNKSLHAYSALALNQAKVFSISVDEPQYIADVIIRLQEMLWNPPLWLKRTLVSDEAEMIEEPSL